MSSKIMDYPGKEVTGEELKARRYLTVPWSGEVKYAWASGVALSRFLHGLKEGKILARRCQNCRRVMVPPRMFCEECFKPTDEWIEVEDRGTINTYSVCYVGTDARRLETPTIVAVIELRGASPGMGILHHLGRVTPEQVRVGMKVKAEWKPKEKREGAITDIIHFEPEEG